MIVLENFFQSLIAGVLIGAVYGLMCVGLGLIFGLMRVINFAQGEFLMLGMYGAFYTFGWFGLSGMFGPVLAALLSSVFSFAMGWLVHRFILSNSTGRAVAGTEGDRQSQMLKEISGNCMRRQISADRRGLAIGRPQVKGVRLTTQSGNHRRASPTQISMNNYYYYYY